MQKIVILIVGVTLFAFLGWAAVSPTPVPLARRGLSGACVPDASVCSSGGADCAIAGGLTEGTRKERERDRGKKNREEEKKREGSGGPQFLQWRTKGEKSGIRKDPFEQESA